MGVSLESVLVVLTVQLRGEALAEVGLRNASRPQTEAHGDLLCHYLTTVLVFLGEQNSVGLDFLDAGVGLDVDRVVRESLLRQIDSKLTSLPATAQRANQQGQYLARKFNKIAQAAPGMKLNDVDYGDIDDAVYKAFEYHHLGSLAYVGNAAIFDYNGYGLSGGLLAVYLWRGVYFAQSVSFRTRALLAMDWTKRALFGRGEFTTYASSRPRQDSVLTYDRSDELLSVCLAALHSMRTSERFSGGITRTFDQRFLDHVLFLSSRVDFLCRHHGCYPRIHIITFSIHAPLDPLSKSLLSCPAPHCRPHMCAYFPG